MITSTIVYFNLKNILIENSTNYLLHNAKIISNEISYSHNPYLLTKHVERINEIKIEIFDATGNEYISKNTHINLDTSVFKDSNSSISVIKNSNGEEILQLLTRSTYKNEPIYIMLSQNLNSIMGNYYNLIFNIVIIFLIAILIAMVITYSISTKIKYELNQLTIYLNDLANKKYKSNVKPRYFQEFLHITFLLKELGKKLARREKQKRKYNAKLRFINKQRNDILSALSHEFKNPVASIIGYTETLIYDPDADIEIRKKFLSKILSNGKKISTMIDRLSLSVKLENESLQMTLTPFSITKVTKELISNMQDKLQARDILINGQDVTVYADQTLIEIVISNLINNALKYSEGDIIITINDELFSIEDHGIGISKEDIKHITTKFYRVQKNQWDNSIGVGLSIVTYILGMHGSELNIESELNHGSVFSFSLEPLAEDKNLNPS